MKVMRTTVRNDWSLESVLLPPPPQPFGTPGVFDLLLPDGRWRLTATTATYPDGIGWRVSREVVIASNAPPPDATVGIPETNAGPQLAWTHSTPARFGIGF